jgi:predicted flap endonuclease-1-like 5' DNA nuclease
MRLPGTHAFFRTARRALRDHALYTRQAGLLMMANGLTDDLVDGGGRMQDRESGIVDVVKREARPVTGAKEPEKTRGDDIDVEAEVVLDDGAIEVLDEEIEVAAELPARPTLPSPPSSTNVIRSRPPMRPSGRPRASSSSSALPPPRASTRSESASGWPASSRPNSSDPWLLANKTLELSRAHARIAELEEHVAFRDARILTLEEKLEQAQQRLDDLEQKPSVGRNAATPLRSAVATKPVVTETRLVAAAPKPAVKPAVTPAVAFGVSTNPVAPIPTALDAEDEDADDLDDLVSDEQGGGDGIDAAQPLAGNPLAGNGVESDLQQISGIGPRFEAALRKQGITRLSQIAAWSEADVRQVAKALKIPKSRIVKGRWVEAAREAVGTRSASE